MFLRVLQRMALAVAAVSLAVAAGATPAAAATAPTFAVTIGSSCSMVFGTPTGAVVVRQLDPSGIVLQSISTGFAGDGSANACFDDVFLPGMKVRATADALTRTFTVPKLGLSVDRTTDVIRGTAPAGKHVRVSVEHRVRFTSGASYTFDRTVSSTGAWSIDTTSTVNLIGGDTVHVMYDNGTDAADTYRLVPSVTVRIGSSSVDANLLFGQSGSVVLRTSSGTLRAKAYFAGTFDFEANSQGRFVNSAGLRVAPRVGDRVSAPFQPSMAFTIPNLTVSINSTTNIVSGACPANRRLLVAVDTGATIPLIEAKCAAGGSYSVDTTASVDIVAGAKITVSAKLASGDIVTRSRVAG